MTDETKIVAVANKKGGVGKSTVTINLAAAAPIQTAIIDLDPDQQAAAKWSDDRGAGRQPKVFSAVYSRLSQSIDEAKGEGAKLILLDTPALVDSIIIAAIKAAAFVLIPCRTTGQDIQYLPSTLDLVAAQQKPAAVVLNSVEPRLRETAEAPPKIESFGVTLVPQYLSKSVVYHRAITASLGVTELDPKGNAAEEIRNLWTWINGLLYVSTPRHVDT